MKQFGPALLCMGVIIMSSVAHAQGTGGPSYASPAGRSPTAPGVATSPAGTAPTQSGQPAGTRTILKPSNSEFGTPIPGVTTR